MRLDVIMEKFEDAIMRTIDVTNQGLHQLPLESNKRTKILKKQGAIKKAPSGGKRWTRHASIPMHRRKQTIKQR
jgi:hypothetical protein